MELPEPRSLLLDMRYWNVYPTCGIHTNNILSAFTWVPLLWSRGTLIIGPHLASVIKVCPAVAVCISYIQVMVMRMPLAGGAFQ